MTAGGREFQVAGAAQLKDRFPISVEQQRFTIRSGVLTSTSSRRRGAVRDSPLPQRTDIGSAVAYSSWTDPSQLHYGLHLAMFSGNDSLF